MPLDNFASSSIRENVERAIPDIQRRRLELDLPLEITTDDLANLFESPVVDEDITNLVRLRQQFSQPEIMPSLSAIRFMDEVKGQINAVRDIIDKNIL